MKRKFKLILAGLLCAVMCIVIIPMTNVFAAKNVKSGTFGEEENLTWTLDDEGTLTISGKGEMEDYYEDFCDDLIDFYQPQWYDERNSIKSVVIKSGVTNIGWPAFSGCSNLTSVEIPDSVEYIGAEAFLDCISLESINIPSGVSEIYENSFYNCIKLKDITVDEKNEEYSSLDGVLFNKDKTDLIIYPAGNEKTSYIVPDSVTLIDSEAFKNCSNLTNIALPNALTVISSHAFSDCINLKDITIPDSVISIGYCSFKNCSSFTSVTIPDNLTDIDSYAFSGCSNLTSINVSKNNKEYSSLDGVLFNKDKTKLIQFPIGNERTSYVIPDSVTTTEWYSFADCVNLKSITIPAGVKEINGYTFLNCSALKNIEIPDGITAIERGSFSGCSSLSSIIIPGSVKDIFGNAFKDCNSLKNVYYPGSEKAWNSIVISSGNKCLTKSNIHFNHKHTYKDVITKANADKSKNGSNTPTCDCGKTKSKIKIYYPKTVKLSKTGYVYTGKALKQSRTVRATKSTQSIIPLNTRITQKSAKLP